MVDCIKFELQEVGNKAETELIADFKKSNPVLNDVSNEYRNRSWDFNYGEDETIHFMWKNPDETIKHIEYDFMDDTYLNHKTSVDGVDGVNITFTIFKSDVLNYLDTEFKFPETSRRIDECIMIDFGCNIMVSSKTDNRKCFRGLASTINGIGPNSGIQTCLSVFGGNKRHNLKRKTLKSKLRHKKNTKRLRVLFG
jgi:hypothetical protein